MGTLSLTKKARIYNGGKTVSSISGAGNTGQLCVNTFANGQQLAQTVKNLTAVWGTWV